MANLGNGYSSDTDGERKHLHLGIHLGEVVDIRGYVQKKNSCKIGLIRVFLCVTDNKEGCDIMGTWKIGAKKSNCRKKRRE